MGKKYRYLALALVTEQVLTLVEKILAGSTKQNDLRRGCNLKTT